MEFKVQKKELPKPPARYGRDDVAIAFRFARSIWKEFDRFCRAIVLFGSSVKQSHEENSDIDILVIVDDVSYVMTPEVIETYRIIIERYVANVSKRLHITTLKFTSFWEFVRVGDPIGLNILRDGVALLDTGFFTPLQLLLFQGRLRPTREAVIAYSSRVPQTMHNSKWHLMQATLDLYWAAIDGAHAALMHLGEMPENPSKIPSLIKEKLVKPRHVHARCAAIMQELFDISKKILHRDLKEIKGHQYDRLQRDAEFFAREMKAFLEKKHK